MHVHSLTWRREKLFSGLPKLLIPAILVSVLFGVLFKPAPATAQGKVVTVPPVNGTTNWGAITFNLRTKKAIRIDTIFVNTGGTGSVNLEVWYKKTGINGQPTSAEFTSAPVVWTNVLSSASVVANTNLAPIPIPGGLLIPANSYYGFYIGDPGFSTTGIRYAASSTIDSATDGTITIKMGNNIGYGWVRNGTTTNHPRWFAGGIRYRLATSAKNNGAVAGILPTNFCPGSQDIKATISNEGGNQIKSIKINWSKDGVLQTPVTYTGTLDTFGGSGSRSATVTLGNHTFSANTPVDLKVWISDVNSTTDPDQSNDTLKTKNMASLSGTLTVGSGKTYATLQAAVNDLIKYGVCGAVTLDVASGTLTGRTVITAIPGASATNTITIKGAGKTSTTLTYASTGTTDAQTILLDGADYITIRDLTVANTGATYGFAVLMTNAADYNLIDGCNINTSTTSTSATVAGIVCSGSLTSATTAGNSGNYNIVRNNTINGGAYGVVFYGSGTGSYIMGNQILNNTITNFYNYGTYSYYGGEAKVIGNKMTSTRQTTTYGMLFYYQSNYEVARNDISVPYYAIVCYYTNNYLYNASGTQATINNNFFNSSGFHGAYIYYPDYLNFHYNTVRGNNTYAGYFNDPFETSVKGNIFWNTTANYAFYLTAGSFSYLDYNVYYGTATNLFYYNAAITNLAAWQNAMPQYNKNSWQQDPKLNSSSDLHISQTVTVPWGPDDIYTLDVDGHSRCRFAPTVGADESGLGKTAKPTAGMNAPDTIFVNSPTDFYGNQTPGVPHGNRWYVNNVLMKDSVDMSLTLTSTGSYDIKVVAYGCQKTDSTTKTIIVVNPTSVPVPGFLADKNIVKPGEIVTLTELTTGGATSLKWEVTPTKAFDANGNPIDRYTYVSGNDGSRSIRIRMEVAGAYKVCLTATNSIGSKTVCKEAYIRVLPGYNMALTTPTKTFTVNDSAGYIYDHAGPNGLYSPSLATSALIAPCASEVYLIVKKFELECGWDYLRVYDGENNKGKVLHPCTTNLGSANGPGLTGLSTTTCAAICRPVLSVDTFKALSGKMYLEMATDGSGQYDGFEAYWWSKPKKVDPPMADFDFESTVCVDMPVFFTNKSTGESVTYLWDLDGNLADIETTSKDAAYAYFAPGKYTVTLIANNCGGTDTMQQDITVINPNPPAVSFAADNINPTTNDIVRFSPDIQECVSDYMWRFTPAPGVNGKAVYVNGTKSSSENPEINFTDTGCYHVFLYANNAGGDDSLQLNCFIKVKGAYCIPTVTTSIVDIGISEVTIADLDNNVILNRKSTSGVEDYQNFTPTVSTTLERGVGYDLTVSRGTTLNEVTRTVWIDWNLDGDFSDANEKVGEQKKSSSLSWTHRFKVPRNASIGATVMRIAINQGNLANSICGPNRYGEYEDYRIYLTPDLTPPVITLNGEDTVVIEQGRVYTEASAVAEDNLNGIITHLMTKKNAPTFDNMIPGTYLVHFDVADSSGNPATRVTRVVIVTPDATAPTLIVSATDTIRVAVFDVNYTDPETLFADDLVDGDLSGEVLKSGAVDINKVGIYELTFTVADQTGNVAKVTRIVIVEDLEAPKLSLINADTVYHEANTAYTDAGVTYNDNYCTVADMSANLVMTSNVVVTQAGIYKVIYNLTDCNGNKASIVRTVIVKDDESPMITMNGDTLVVLDVFDTYTDQNVIATDNYGKPTVDVSGTFFSTFTDGKATTLGDYTVIYTATDSFGNKTAAMRVIRVVDREAPVIGLKGVPTANVCRWAEYKDAGYDLSDNYWATGDITVSPEGDFINTLQEGVFSMRYRAEDKSGNVAYSDWRIVRVVDANEGACITGLNPDNTLSDAIDVFPNPTTGKFTLRLDLSSEEQVSARVVNALGQEVALIAGGNMSAGTIAVDLSGQASGVYMLHITAGNKTAVKRIVLSR